MYTSLRSRFDAEDTAQVFVWVEKFSCNPWSGMLGTLRADQSSQRVGGKIMLPAVWLSAPVNSCIGKNAFYCLHLIISFC